MGKCQKERVLRYKRRQEKYKQRNRKYIKIYIHIWKEVCDEMIDFIEKESIQFEEVIKSRQRLLEHDIKLNELKKKQKEEEERRKKENVIRKSKDYLKFIFLDVDISDDEKQLHVNRLNKILDELY